MSEPVEQIRREYLTRATEVHIAVHDTDGHIVKRLAVPLGDGVEIYVDTDMDRLVGPIRIDKFGNAFK